LRQKLWRDESWKPWWMSLFFPTCFRFSFVLWNVPVLQYE